MSLNTMCLTPWLVLTLLASAQGQDPDELRQKVKTSIAAGVAFLKESQTVAGTWKFQGNDSPDNELVIGVSALCGLALLENQVLTKDASVQKVYKLVNDAAKKDVLKSNFSVCMAVMFLHRYHRDRMVVARGRAIADTDDALVQKLADQIVSGQGKDGLWTKNGLGGHENTQLALMALWLARKHADDVARKHMDEAIAACEKRLRTSQQSGGGWSPYPSFFGINMKPTRAMTCTGLLGIALHVGVVMDNQLHYGQADAVRKLQDDSGVAKAREFLATALQELQSSNADGIDSTPTRSLWSVSLAARLYKWRRINGVDWFEVGASFLISKQSRNGSWTLDMQTGEYVDTAYSLLFLSKSNLLGDLQIAMRGPGPLVRGPQRQPPNKDAAALAKEALARLLAAPDEKQEDILEEMGWGKGAEYTEALLEAIRKLPTVKSKAAAREALARRFQRFTVKVLTQYLEDDDRELRLAAVKAIRFKPDRDLKKHVIPLLSDKDARIAAAALETLKAFKE